MEVLIGIGVLILVVFVTMIWLASRYHRCPSDKILVVFGRVADTSGGGKQAAKCYHGGGVCIWPVIQDYKYLDLTPMQIDIVLENALSAQNIRVTVPAAFTVGISTEPGVMENAAERLLGMQQSSITELARDLIFGQMRVVIATMSIEAINADREKLVSNIANGVEVELKKVGLRLINVNIKDIRDESKYIEALGKEAAAHAINEAMRKVAEKTRDGEIGKAEAERDMRIRVAAAMAEAAKGENEAAVVIANSVSSRKQREAEANRLATAAEKVQAAEALREAYKAEELTERQRAEREKAALNASVIVKAEIDRETVKISAEAQRQRIEIEAEAAKTRTRLESEANQIKIRLTAEAEGERLRVTQTGDADGIKAVMLAKADGIKAQLDAKAQGFKNIVEAAGSASDASRLLVVEQLPTLVEAQMKAISNVKFDKITVWDGGKGTANWLSSLAGALPPLGEIAKSVDFDLPGFLGGEKYKGKEDTSGGAGKT